MRATRWAASRRANQEAAPPTGCSTLDTATSRLARSIHRATYIVSTGVTRILSALLSSISLPRKHQNQQLAGCATASRRPAKQPSCCSPFCFARLSQQQTSQCEFLGSHVRPPRQALAPRRGRTAVRPASHVSRANERGHEKASCEVCTSMRWSMSKCEKDGRIPHGNVWVAGSGPRWTGQPRLASFRGPGNVYTNSAKAGVAFFSFLSFGQHSGRAFPFSGYIGGDRRSTISKVCLYVRRGRRGITGSTVPCTYIRCRKEAGGHRHLAVHIYYPLGAVGKKAPASRARVGGKPLHPRENMHGLHGAGIGRRGLARPT